MAAFDCSAFNVPFCHDDIRLNGEDAAKGAAEAMADANIEEGGTATTTS